MGEEVKTEKDLKKKYDLEERTARFGEDVIMYCKRLPCTLITAPLIHQIIKAATSIGANYAEADDAESKDDFRHKIGICKKESRETKHFLRMIVTAVDDEALQKEAKILWQEVGELHLIFNSIFKKVR